MEKQRVKTEIEIDASADRVWAALTTDEAVRQWANEYEAGMYAESAWEKGAEITWNFKDGSVCLRGKIDEFDEPNKLQTRLYEEGADQAIAEPITEHYFVTEQDGKTVLTLDFGPFGDDGYEMIKPATEKAAQKIKQIAEGK